MTCPENLGHPDRDCCIPDFMSGKQGVVMFVQVAEAGNDWLDLLMLLGQRERRETDRRRLAPTIPVVIKAVFLCCCPDCPASAKELRQSRQQ